MVKQHVVVKRARRRPQVFVKLDGFFEGWPRIVEFAREHDWQLVDPRYRGIDPLKHLVPDASLVDELPSTPIVRRLLKLGCPVVRIGNLPHPQDSRVPAAMPDMPGMGALAADHFAERGFTQLGYVGHQPWSARRTLYEGFRDRARVLGVRCHLLRWKGSGEMSAEAKYRHRQGLVADWLREIPKPVGLLGFVDGHAAQLCCMARDAGFAVPEEVAVLGNGNILPACEGSLPTLSSIAPDPETVADAAVRMLQQLMDGETLAETTVMVPAKGIVVRESTDLLAVADLHVARALRFMWDHFDLDLSVDQVAAEVGASRRTLERDFRAALGRSVNVELRRKRLEELKRLLRNTDESIADLAPQVGFRSAQYLHRAFRAAFGMSPREYRMQKWGKGK